MSEVVHTAESLRQLKFKGPVRFFDGARGMAQQDFEAVGLPRFGYSWRRENRNESGRKFYTVDGDEVADLEAAAKALMEPPNPDSSMERLRRIAAEFDLEPRLDHGATRCGNFADRNGDAGAFGTVRAWMSRSGHAWHVGINAFSDAEREAGRDFPRWLYNAKHAMHESYRGAVLFRADRESDTALRCSLGTYCRECPILQTIERQMQDQRANSPFPRVFDDADIDSAKVATCIGHILQSGTNPVDGAFWSRPGDGDFL